MCSRHVHILPRIKAYSILLFPSLPARVRGGNNGEICRTSVSAYTSGPDGRTIHAAIRHSFLFIHGHLQMGF